MYIADMEYHTYEARLTREMQDEGLLATAVNLGLTTSSTLVPLAQTKTLLSGIATGVTGLDKAYDQKELLSNTIQALQTQMRADRKTQAAVLYAKMFKDAGNNTKTITPIAEYPLPMALSDTDAYYQAGTVASSLIGLSKTVANAETNADQAKSASGPNPAAVTDAKATAAPLSPPTTAQVMTIRNPSTPLPNPKPIVIPVPSGDPRFTRTERNLLPSHIKEWQAALCVKPDGKLGEHHSETRKAIRAYLISLPNGGRVASDNSDASFEIGPREAVLLNILADNPKSCP